MNKEFSIESFIEYCDNMMIANEGVGDFVKENPGTTAGLVLMALAGLYVKGQSIKANMDKKAVERKKKIDMIKLKEKAKTVYMLSDKKMEGVFKISGTVYPSIDKENPIKYYSCTVPGGTVLGKVTIHESFKSILNSKLYLYTLDGSENVTIDKYGSLTTNKDLPIKNVEEATYLELLNKYNIEYEIIKSNVSERKQMVTKYTKEILDFVKKENKDVIGKGAGIGAYNYDDELEEFVYGLSDTLTIITWDLWEIDSSARASVQDGKFDKFFDAINKVIDDMNNKYKNVQFEQDGDWDDGRIYMTIKKK